MPETDRAAILEACQLLCEPGSVVELRALDAISAGWPMPHTVAGYFRDWHRLAAAAAGQQARGIYLTLNPVAEALLARAVNRLKDCRRSDPLTKDPDIVRRRWLPIDLDAVRPSGISATDAEHALALARAREVAAWLAGQGWPAPILADSGNGSHLLYRVDLPAVGREADLVRDALAALDHRFTDALVRVDAENHNPARIWKLYGTVACKGDATPDRPHRLSRILEAPAAPAVVDPALLAALAARRPQARPAAGRAQPGRPDFDLEGWLRDHGLAVSAAKEWEEGTRWVFDVCPWNPEHTDRSAYIVRLANGAIAAGCHHNSCAGRDWRALRELVEGPGWNRDGRPAAVASLPAARSVARAAASSRGEPAPAVADLAAAGADERVAEDAAGAASASAATGSFSLPLTGPADASSAAAGGLPALPESAGADAGSCDCAAPDAPTAAVDDCTDMCADDIAAILAEIRAAPDRDAVEDLLPELTPRCVGLDRNALLRVDRALHKAGIPQERIRDWRRALAEQRRAARATEPPAEDGVPPPVDPQRLADFAPFVRWRLGHGGRAGVGRNAKEFVGAELRGFLLGRGRLLYEARHNDAERTPYLLTDACRTIAIAGRGNLPLEAALAEAGLNASEPAYEWVVSDLASTAYNFGRQVSMHRYSFTDTAAQAVHISCGPDSYVSARPGRPLVRVRNGEDNIIFDAAAVFPAWDPTAAPADFRTLVGFQPPLVAPAEALGYTPEIQRSLLYAYVLGVLSGQRPLPIGMLIGGKGGGKSTAGRSILRQLLGPDANLGTLGSDPRDLTVRAACQALVTFDNLDNPPEPWALDAIAACVTGAAKIERELYTNARMIDIIMDAALLVTTRTAPFDRADIIERILPLFTDDLADGDRISEQRIYAEIAAQRSATLAFMARLAAEMLPLRRDAPADLPGRFVDFAQLVYAYYAVEGRAEEARPALAAWQRAYTLAIGEPDPLLKAIVEYLPPNGFQRLTATQLTRQLATALHDAGDEALPYMGGAKAIAGRLRELRGALEQLGLRCRVEQDKIKGQSFFTILPPRGAGPGAVVASSAQPALA